MDAAGPAILFVHRSITLRARVCMGLWQLGYWADVVATLQRAFAALQYGRYELIFIELALQHGSGYDAVQKIRDIEAMHRIPASVICAIGQIFDDAMLKGDGVQGVSFSISADCAQHELREAVGIAEAVCAARGLIKGGAGENSDCG